VSATGLAPIFRQAHLRLKPRTAVPEILAEFFPFAGLTHTVRLREDRLLVRVSDLFTDAPEPVLEALALILLGRLYRRKAGEESHSVYRGFILQTHMQERARKARTTRGRGPRPGVTRGRWRDLDATFAKLNQEYFQASLERPRLSWSIRRSRRVLGRYDATHNAIFVSRVFDSPNIPEFVLEYVLYHEMLHMKHPSRLQDCRLVAHPPEFRAEERRFLHFANAMEWLRKI
jgi:predicted metal-dependent hydrolase